MMCMSNNEYLISTVKGMNKRSMNWPSKIKENFAVLSCVCVKFTVRIWVRIRFAIEDKVTNLVFS